jgi:hypothetical protein
VIQLHRSTCCRCYHHCPVRAGYPGGSSCAPALRPGNPGIGPFRSDRFTVPEPEDGLARDRMRVHRAIERDREPRLDVEPSSVFIANLTGRRVELLLPDCGARTSDCAGFFLYYPSRGQQPAALSRLIDMLRV